MIDYKFREPELLDEFKRYIDSTYDQHYAKNKFQSTEVIIERGHGTGFCMGNVDKYSNRYGNKGTRDDARKDLMKILHYTLLQLYVHDHETNEEILAGLEKAYLDLVDVSEVINCDDIDMSVNLSGIYNAD